MCLEQNILCLIDDGCKMGVPSALQLIGHRRFLRPPYETRRRDCNRFALGGAKPPFSGPGGPFIHTAFGFCPKRCAYAQGYNHQNQNASQHTHLPFHHNTCSQCSTVAFKYTEPPRSPNGFLYQRVHLTCVANRAILTGIHHTSRSAQCQISKTMTTTSPGK